MNFWINWGFSPKNETFLGYSTSALPEVCKWLFMSQLAFKCLWETLGGTPTLTSLNKQRRHPTEHRGEENPAAFPLEKFFQGIFMILFIINRSIYWEKSIRFDIDLLDRSRHDNVHEILTLFTHQRSHQSHKSVFALRLCVFFSHKNVWPSSSIK